MYRNQHERQIRRRVSTWRQIIPIITLLAACSSTGPSTPFTLATATGSYTISLAKAPASSYGPSCSTVTVTFGQARNWTGVCQNGVTPTGTVSTSADTLVLEVATTPSSARHIKLRAFDGTTESLRSEWSGGTCWPVSVGCIREFGEATWHR